MLCALCGCFPVALIKQLTARADGALGLPERGAAIVAQRVERADVGERDQLVAAKAAARDEIVERGEAARMLGSLA